MEGVYFEKERRKEEERKKKKKKRKKKKKKEKKWQEVRRAGIEPIRRAIENIIKKRMNKI